MKTAIIGTGGVGGFFGAKMANAGIDVTFLARGKHLQAMQSDGLKIHSVAGDFTVKTVKVTDSIKEMGMPDLVILGVKAWQVKDVAKELKDILHEESVVLPLQNGVLAAEELEQEIPGKHIIGGLCRIMSKIEAPGVINHFGIDPEIVFGELGATISPRVEKVKELFDNAGIKAHISKDINMDLWKKFIAICASGFLAVTRSTYGEIRELKETREMMRELFNEIYRVSQKAGIHINPDFIDKSIAFIDTFPYDATSSLTRDVWEGKPSEIEYQNGAVVRLGKKFGVETPINEFINKCILPMELRAKKE